ncbi:MAG: histidine--tRNA ligase [Alphaproteobacteria bacterium]|nr:histidine--tRNA ligase [Alphaproteobacteria bacterium]MBP7759636.1 histidine--tRNA ligase [Alphaproteobacteria bacterium]MBP7762986.1 histidine--tRNA ligase [Alphaproteobacteria bacterium]MBP7904455.1 histidine--tRNA ligase [Alphaproteobacteria bacterium]
MSEKKKIFKPQPVSGFPEWLPEVRAVELQWFDHIRRIFESYGFCNIETPSVELLDALKAKGGDGEADVDKEIYVLERYHKEDGDKEARLALHFDQTVPLARYTAQHFNDLVFPFKRYQMQRVWRGERPQAGRFREFYQCDIDVINVDSLPQHFDAEMPAIIWETLSSLPGMEKERIQIRVSNRKILTGYLNAVGIYATDLLHIIFRNLDKIEKIGLESATENIIKYCSDNNINFGDKSLNEPIGLFSIFAAQRYQKTEEINQFLSLLNNKYPALQNNSLFIEGVQELSFILDQLSHLPSGAVVADLSIVRGLDYYTGTVYETVFLDDPGYGSICSGGRYDDLAGNYINKHLPGVGISIGFSRLFDRLRQQGKLPVGRLSPADILVIMPSEERRALTMDTAQKLRKQGHKVETFHNPVKLARQLAYAEKKGIPYVWFPPFEDGKPHEVKNMQTKAQTAANPDDWKKD